MTELTPELLRPRGRYGVDGDYRLIPAPVLFGSYLLLCLSAAVLAAMWLATKEIGSGVVAAVVAVVLVATGGGILRFSRRGKFEVWARLLMGLGLRGDERVLDLGCGRGAVLLAVAKLVPRGRAVGVDIWRADQTGNSVAATVANADVEGVTHRIELHTQDMTDLQFPDASFDLVVSSLAIHNLSGNHARCAAIDEAIRVLRPGGRVVIADIGFTRLYATRLRQRGMTNVKREDLGWRAWWGLPLIRTHAVTATKPQPGAKSVSRVVALEESFVHPRVWEVFPAALQRRYEPMRARLSDVGIERIRLMDAAGIDVQVLSHVQPGIQVLPDGDVELAVDICREVNDWLAEAIAAHPTRLAGFAMLPTQSPTQAAQELQRTVRDLGFKGALINGHTNGRYLDEPSFDVLLSRAESLGVPIYIHPTDPPQAVSDVYYAPFDSALVPTWGWPVETGTHVLRLICAGVFDRHPDLKIIVGHMGELLPYCFTRLNLGLTMAGWLLASQGMRNTVGYYLHKNVFITSSGVFDVPVFECARTLLGLDNLMFSVDYPFQDNFAAMEFLKRCDLSPEDRERFAHSTAENLLRLDNRPSAIGTASVGFGDFWYRLRTRLRSKMGRALISALVK